jgi:hypothetical protein
MMNTPGAGKQILLTCAAVLVAVAAGALIGYSQDKTSELAQQLEQLSTELRQQREGQNHERELLENRKSLLLEEIENLKRRHQEASGRNADLVDECAKLKETLRKASVESDALTQQRIAIEKLIGEKTALLANHIESGLPLDTASRRNYVAEVMAGAQTPAEELKLLWQLYVQEYRRAGEIEVSSPLTKPESEEDESAENSQTLGYTVQLENGARIQGSILRIGSVGAVFLSDDGNTGAILVRQPEGYAWQEASTHEMLALLRQAFEIAVGRRAPELTRVPLELPQAGGGQ